CWKYCGRRPSAYERGATWKDAPIWSRHSCAAWRQLSPVPSPARLWSFRASRQCLGGGPWWPTCPCYTLSAFRFSSDNSGGACTRQALVTSVALNIRVIVVTLPDDPFREVYGRLTRSASARGARPGCREACGIKRITSEGRTTFRGSR